MSEKRKAILGIAACIIIVFIVMIIFSACEGDYDISAPIGEDNSNQAVGEAEKAAYDFDDTTGGEEMVRNRRISASYARELMKRYPNAIILDVRSESEFATGHIPGAILLPDFDIEDRAREVLYDYNTLILVYCRSGARSRAATYLLVSMGYKNVYDFGGINSWPYEVE